jgi:hypothetical protein
MYDEISIEALNAVTGGRRGPVAATASPGNANLLPLITQLSTMIKDLQASQSNNVLKIMQAFLQLRGVGKK